MAATGRNNNKSFFVDIYLNIYFTYIIHFRKKAYDDKALLNVYIKAIAWC